MRRPLKIQQMVSLYWRPDHAGHFRVWRGDWPDGTFEVLDAVQFNQVCYVAARFSIRLIEWQDQWDNDGVEPLRRVK